MLVVVVVVRSADVNVTVTGEAWLDAAAAAAASEVHRDRAFGVHSPLLKYSGISIKVRYLYQEFLRTKLQTIQPIKSAAVKTGN